jgi:hypothetical protein
VLVGGTGTGKSHLAIAIARACIRGGAIGRFINVVDPDLGELELLRLLVAGFRGVSLKMAFSL